MIEHDNVIAAQLNSLTSSQPYFVFKGFSKEASVPSTSLSFHKKKLSHPDWEKKNHTVNNGHMIMTAITADLQNEQTERSKKKEKKM